MPILGIHHIQIAIPQGKEAEARSFYGQMLGLKELTKPSSLTARGGAWYQCGSQELHLGVDEAFVAARKTHPAFRVVAFELLLSKLQEENIAMVEDNAIPYIRRVFISDPFGNRIELISAD